MIVGKGAEEEGRGSEKGCWGAAAGSVEGRSARRVGAIGCGAVEAGALLIGVVAGAAAVASAARVRSRLRARRSRAVRLASAGTKLVGGTEEARRFGLLVERSVERRIVK